MDGQKKMNQVPYQGPRIAPSPESHEALSNLDIVIVIPAYREGTEILNMLWSIAQQKIDSKNGTVVHGVVLNINNRAEDVIENSEAYQENIRTYMLVQAIKYGWKISTLNDEESHKKVQDIQESNLRIEVIDSFSSEHAHESNNVGMARRLATEHSITLLKNEDGGIISTDADAQLALKTVQTVVGLLENESVDIFPLQTRNLVDGAMDGASKDAFSGYRLYWDLQRAHKTLSLRMHDLTSNKTFFDTIHEASGVEQSQIVTSGGYTGMRASAYKKSGGYQDIHGAEDTRLANSIVESGGSLRDLKKKYPNALIYQRPRISDRTEVGYGWGHTIAKFDSRMNDFADIMVNDPMVAIETTEFLEHIDSLLDARKYDNLSKEEVKKFFVAILEEYAGDPMDKEGLWQVFDKWNGAANTAAHFDFLKGAQDFFKGNFKEVPLSFLIDGMGVLNKTYFNEAASLSIEGYPITPLSSVWEWDVFESEILDLLSMLKIPLNKRNVLQKVRGRIAVEYARMMPPLVEYNIRYRILQGKIKVTSTVPGHEEQIEEQLRIFKQRNDTEGDTSLNKMILIALASSTFHILEDVYMDMQHSFSRKTRLTMKKQMRHIYTGFENLIAEKDQREYKRLAQGIANLIMKKSS